MILTFILNVFYGFVSLVISFLPNSSPLPQSFDDAFNYIFGLLWNFDVVISVSNLIVVLGLATVFQGTILFVRLVLWVIRLVRGQ